MADPVRVNPIAVVWGSTGVRSPLKPDEMTAGLPPNLLCFFTRDDTGETTQVGQGILYDAYSKWWAELNLPAGTSGTLTAILFTKPAKPSSPVSLTVLGAVGLALTDPQITADSFQPDDLLQTWTFSGTCPSAGFQVSCWYDDGQGGSPSALQAATVTHQEGELSSWTVPFTGLADGTYNFYATLTTPDDSTVPVTDQGWAFAAWEDAQVFSNV
jgi:hypothetical protein